VRVESKVKDRKGRAKNKGNEKGIMQNQKKREKGKSETVSLSGARLRKQGLQSRQV
jgi:hypothetical protein